MLRPPWWLAMAIFPGIIPLAFPDAPEAAPYTETTVVEPISPSVVYVNLYPTPTDLPEDEARCWESVAMFQEEALEMGTAISCIAAPYGEATGWAGLYSGTITVISWPGTEVSYYREVVAHELGHAYDARVLTSEIRLEAMAVLGWAQWDMEHYADLYAFQRGLWADYGDGWRHDGGIPTPEVLDALVALGALPEGP